MNYELFNETVIDHRNMIIFIGILVLLFALIGALVIEFYVRRNLDCQFFEIGKIKVSPTLIMIIPTIAILFFFSINVYKCNQDIEKNDYIEYVGKVEYSESSIKLVDKGFTFFVGKGHEIVPAGLTYGKIIYSKRSKVIVYYIPIE